MARCRGGRNDKHCRILHLRAVRVSRTNKPPDSTRSPALPAHGPPDRLQSVVVERNISFADESDAEQVAREDVIDVHVRVSLKSESSAQIRRSAVVDTSDGPNVDRYVARPSAARRLRRRYDSSGAVNAMVFHCFRSHCDSHLLVAKPRCR